MAKKKTVASTKKKNIKLPAWKLFVKTTFNNTIVTLTDEKGNKVLWWWTWLVGFKGTKESTPYAAEVLTREVVKEARDNFWLKEISIKVHGLWLWRDWVFKAINDLWGVDISSIREATSIQFWWCKGERPKRN